MAVTDEMTDEELLALGGSYGHLELERRRAARGRQFVAVEDDAGRARLIAASHVVSSTGRGLVGAAERMARAPVPQRATGNRGLFVRTAAAATEAQAEHVRRAQDAVASDRVTGQLSASPGSGGWERMAGRAHFAAGSTADGDPAPSPYTDPDDLPSENRALGTPGARPVNH